MLKLYDGGAYLVNGTEIITDEAEVKAKTGREVSKEEARTQTMAYGIWTLIIHQAIWRDCRSNLIS